MRRIDQKDYEDEIEKILMKKDKEKKLFTLNDAAREEALRLTRIYEVDNIKDLLDQDNYSELTFTEPLTKRIRTSSNEIIKDRFKGLRQQQKFEWIRYNFDIEEHEEFKAYQRFDFSLSYSISTNLVLVRMFNVYALNFENIIRKTWQAWDFDIFDGTGAIIKAGLPYRHGEYQDTDLLEKFNKMKNLNGSKPVDIVFRPLPINYTNSKGSVISCDPKIMILNISDFGGDRHKTREPVPVEYNTN